MTLPPCEGGTGPRPLLVSLLANLAAAPGLSDADPPRRPFRLGGNR